MKRVILLVLDSAGIGEMPDAEKFGDKGSNTIGNIAKEMGGIYLPNMENMGLGKIAPVVGLKDDIKAEGAYGKAAELSIGKDTVTGHWEMSGVILNNPLKTYPDGFPAEIINEFEKRIGRKVIGNVVASGTEIIKELGDEHVRTGYPIVYTSADSVFQIAAHEDVIPVPELYKMCEIAREMLQGDWTVGRVIARPFIGSYPFTRTANRHDYALDPFSKTMLEYLKENNENVIGVGKISDVFNGKGVTYSVKTKNNMDGIDKTLEMMDKFEGGLIFTNLVEFDMTYGHRNDTPGYKKALEEADARLPEIMEKMKEEDILIITADHGCDPTTPSTDHSREYIPLLVSGKNIKEDVHIETRKQFSDIAATILDYFGIKNSIHGESFLDNILRSK